MVNPFYFAWYSANLVGSRMQILIIVDSLVAVSSTCSDIGVVSNNKLCSCSIMWHSPCEDPESRKPTLSSNSQANIIMSSSIFMVLNISKEVPDWSIGSLKVYGHDHAV
jgi:hypothetical protein